ncbi:hypothetical protein H8356DRAFT_1666820 [Neocallimastix lanati (nom. inval.)]|jgi:HSP20 family molecular chaperone IbpA|nr:hypothetical protein H8356DRAFT_1666820 [Neocallimastix sp. JGI-2020a]
MISLFMPRDPLFDHFSVFNPHSFWNEYDYFDDDFDWFFRNIDNEDYSDDEEREEENETKEVKDNCENKNENKNKKENGNGNEKGNEKKIRNYPYLFRSIIHSHRDHEHKHLASISRPQFLLRRCRSVPYYYPLSKKLHRALLHHNKKMEEKKNNEPKMNHQAEKEETTKVEKEQNLKQKQGQNQEQSKAKEPSKEELKQPQSQEKPQENLQEKSHEKCEKKYENENENSCKNQVTIQRPIQDLETRIFQDFFNFGFNDFTPKINFSEDDQHYYLQADLPGMTRDQVKMEISEDGVLTLSGKREYAYKNGNKDGNEKEENESKNESKKENKMEVETDTKTEMNQAHEEEKKEKYTMMECSYGQFERSLTLPEDIDLDHISAKMENGTLEVVFDKKERIEHIHTIQIQ